MRHKRATATFLTVVALSLLLLVSVGCEPPSQIEEMQSLPPHTPTLPAEPPTPPEPENEQGKPEETAVPTPSHDDVVTAEPDAKEAVAAAKADLLRRLDVTEEEIVVKSVEAVLWRDASLGCPQPGMAYAQVITPGFLIVLEVGEQAHEYHTDRDTAVRLCEYASSSEPPPKGIGATVKDGWPNQPRDNDVIVAPPAERK